MKKRLLYAARLTAGMVAGAAIGYGGVALLTGLTSDGTAADTASEGLDVGLLLLSIVMAAVALVIAALFNTIAHEAGHLLCGLATGYRFLSFRVFRFTLVNDGGRLRRKRYHIAGTAGQCIMELPADQDARRVPWFWYNAGGVLMNILVAAVAVLLLRATHPGVVSLSLLMMMALVGAFMAIVNAVPLTVGGVSNDGRNILLLWRHPDQRVCFLRSLQIVGQMSRGKRMRDMPADWTDDRPLTDPANTLELMNRTAFMSRLYDEGRLDEALAVGREMLSLGKRLPRLFFMEVAGEVTMLTLLTGGDESRVAELWTKQLEQYVKANSRYSPMKCAVLYAHLLLCRRDASAAKACRDRLEQHQDDFTMPGEAKTALFLTTLADERFAQSAKSL